MHTMVCLSLSNRMRGRRYLLHRSKGFRLRKRRLGVSGLRVRVLHFIRLMCRWKWKSTSSCKDGPKLMIKHAPRTSNDKKNYCSGGTTTSDLRITRGMGKEGCACASKIGDTCRSSMSFDLSSSSFYSEAIADCLEFIKKSTLSADDQSIELSTS